MSHVLCFFIAVLSATSYYAMWEGLVRICSLFPRWARSPVSLRLDETSEKSARATAEECV